MVRRSMHTQATLSNQLEAPPLVGSWRAQMTLDYRWRGLSPSACAQHFTKSGMP